MSALDKNKNRGVSLDGFDFFEDAAEMAAKANCDIVVELIGGSEGVARATVEAALRASRHVVTANKALIAVHGTQLALKAEANGTTLAFEAAVAGGIPIIKALREGLASNGIKSIYGILNGTCNYILSRMRDEGIEFQVILLKDAMLKYNTKPTGGSPRSLQFAGKSYVKVPKGTFLIGLPGGLFAVNTKKKFAFQTYLNL